MLRERPAFLDNKWTTNGEVWRLVSAFSSDSIFQMKNFVSRGHIESDDSPK